MNESNFSTAGRTRSLRRCVTECESHYDTHQRINIWLRDFAIPHSLSLSLTLCACFITWSCIFFVCLVLFLYRNTLQKSLTSLWILYKHVNAHMRLVSMMVSLNTYTHTHTNTMLLLLSIKKKLDARRETGIQIMYICRTKLSDYTRSKLRSILSLSLSLPYSIDTHSLLRSSH